MPEIALAPDATMFYRDDDLTDPWVEPEAVLLLHGFAESSVAWNEWIPQLARRYRVIRPDMRGFGRSTPMPIDYPWTADSVIDDFIRLMDSLGIKRFHLAAAKVGGVIAMRFAATHPDRVLSLTITGSTFVPARNRPGHPNVLERRAEFERKGVETWARESMNGRLGSQAPPEMLEAWIALMGATATSTAAGFSSTIPATDVTPDLPRITCPTLVIVIEQGGPGVVEATRERIAPIPHHELAVLPGDSYHVAVTHATQCAAAMLDFIERQGVKA